MKKTITTIFLSLILTAAVAAQIKGANSADVNSADSIVKALYESDFRRCRTKARLG
ncbi:MAG TPA: hypothetical protein VK308_03770 [Pyrinomonadaceae bacterium]|nr:hypothetical protein [Pyrinomonadaceae bacterium]